MAKRKQALDLDNVTSTTSEGDMPAPDPVEPHAEGGDVFPNPAPAPAAAPEEAPMADDPRVDAVYESLVENFVGTMNRGAFAMKPRQVREIAASIVKAVDAASDSPAD